VLDDIGEVSHGDVRRREKVEGERPDSEVYYKGLGRESPTKQL